MCRERHITAQGNFNMLILLRIKSCDLIAYEVRFENRINRQATPVC